MTASPEGPRCGFRNPVGDLPCFAGSEAPVHHLYDWSPLGIQAGQMPYHPFQPTPFAGAAAPAGSSFQSDDAEPGTGTGLTHLTGRNAGQSEVSTPPSPPTADDPYPERCEACLSFGGRFRTDPTAAEVMVILANWKPDVFTEHHALHRRTVAERDSALERVRELEGERDELAHWLEGCVLELRVRRRALDDSVEPGEVVGDFKMDLDKVESALKKGGGRGG